MSDAPPPADPSPTNGDAPPEEASRAGKPAAPRSAGPRPWQGGRFRATAGRGPGPSGRLRAILILLAVMLALGGAVAAWVLYPGSIPRPYFVPIAVDQYSDPLIPVSRWTAQDRDALSGRGWQASNTFTNQERRLLVEQLTNLGRGQATDQPLVVYLRAHALPTSDGGLALLPADAVLDDETSWLPLREVFRLLKACPVQNRLLLLDVMQPFADGRAGALGDDAAGRAEPILREALDDDPHLLVLCACSPGQTSFASEEMGHTVFVHYLMEGLAGKADGWGGGARDNRVSARELAAFVTANVDRWSRHNRTGRQTPALLGPDALDFPLTVADATPVAAETPLAAEYPQGLKEAWELRDAWLADGKVRTPPPLYRQLEDAALHAEERWRGGGKTADVEAALKNDADGLVSLRNGMAGASVRGEPRSLALAVAVGRKPPEKVDDAIDQLMRLAELQRRTAPPTPDPEAAPLLDARKKAFLKDYENKPFELSWVIFRAAREHPEARPEQLRFWLGLLAPDGRLPDYAEIHFVESLAALEVKDPAADWPADAIGSALELADVAEQANAELKLCKPVEPGLAEWLRAWGDEAAERRRAAEGLLLNGKPAERAKAEKPLDAVLTDDARGYKAFRTTLHGLREALRCRDDALRLLPGFAAYLEHNPVRVDDWKKAVDQAEKAAKQARELRQRLARPPEKPSAEWFRDTDADALALRTSLDILLQPVDSHRLHSLITQSPRSGAADAEDMRATLRLPALAAPDRLALWSAWRELAGRLNDESQQTAPAESASSESAPAPDGDNKMKREERALLRARASLALLALEGGRDLAKVEAALQQAAHARDDDTAQQALSRELRAAWKARENLHAN